MDKFNLVKAPQKARFQLNYIWANDPINESKFNVQKHIGHIFTNWFLLHSNYQTHFLCIIKNHCHIHFFKM
jgi:hypothetical protein